MRKQLLTIALLFSIIFTASAQVGIGTNNPDASAQLELSSASKGFLPTRIALTAINVAVPVTAPASGLLVYNTATAGVSPNNVTPGYYYWNGTGWIKIATGTGSLQAGTTPGQIQYWNGTQWILLSPGTYGQTLVMCNGVPTWGGCLPIISKTIAASQITAYSAVTGDTLFNEGGTKTTSGICYNTSPNPTIANNTVPVENDTSAIGVGLAYLYNLAPLTTYYVRAFATNSAGTVYGNQITFTTTADNSAPTITSFTPTAAAQGQTITITGTGFTGALVVSFGGVAASSFTVVNSTTITAVVGSGGASGSVSVTTPLGSASQPGFSFIAPPTSDSVAKANLLAHWTFDTDSKEATSGIAATTSVNVSYSAGRIGNCATFANGYLLYPVISQINNDNALQSYSISMWVNMPTSAASDALRSLFQVTGTKFPDVWGHLDIELINPGPIGDTLSIDSRQVQVDGHSPYIHNQDSWASYGNSTNKWTFITVTYDGSGNNQTKKIYANGTLINTIELTDVTKPETFRIVPTGNYPADGVVPANKVYIGTLAFFDRGNNSGDGYGNFAPTWNSTNYAWATESLTGKLDDIRLFNKTLTAAEITALYTYGSAGK